MNQKRFAVKTVHLVFLGLLDPDAGSLPFSFLPLRFPVLDSRLPLSFLSFFDFGLSFLPKPSSSSLTASCPSFFSYFFTPLTKQWLVCILGWGLATRPWPSLRFSSTGTWTPGPLARWTDEYENGSHWSLIFFYISYLFELKDWTQIAIPKAHVCNSGMRSVHHCCCVHGSGGFGYEPHRVGTSEWKKPHITRAIEIKIEQWSKERNLEKTSCHKIRLVTQARIRTLLHGPSRHCKDRTGYPFCGPDPPRLSWTSCEEDPCCHDTI